MSLLRSALARFVRPALTDLESGVLTVRCAACDAPAGTPCEPLPEDRPWVGVHGARVLANRRRNRDRHEDCTISLKGREPEL